MWDKMLQTLIPDLVQSQEKELQTHSSYKMSLS